MKVSVGVSNRHIHLTENDFKLLFGDIPLTKLRDLKQIGEFASNLTVTIKTDKNELKNVRVLGPFREYTQVEISKTDSYFLGIDPPIRDSSNLEGASLVEIIGSIGSIKKECAIIATRHIHLNTKEVSKYNLNDGDIVKIKVCGIKGGILNNVKVKTGANYTFELHLDTDDANSHNLKTNDIVEIER